MTRRMLEPLAVAAIGACVALLAHCNGGGGCTSRSPLAGCPSAEPATAPIDTGVMAFLSAARALHHEADMAEASGSAADAVAALRRLVAMPAPLAAEVEEVLADAHARLAEMQLKGGDLQGASDNARAGLGHAGEPTYFRGHLLEVQGRIEEARAASLADAGRTDEAATAKTRAMALLEEAVRVQERVIERALADGGER